MPNCGQKPAKKSGFSGTCGSRHTHRVPYRTTPIKNPASDWVPFPPFIKSCFFMLWGFTIRIEAATPTSSSTVGVFSSRIRIFLLKCPRTLGLASSSTIPDTCKYALNDIDGMFGAFKMSFNFSVTPPEYGSLTHPRHLHRSPPRSLPRRSIFVRKPNSAISAINRINELFCGFSRYLYTVILIYFPQNRRIRAFISSFPLRLPDYCILWKDMPYLCSTDESHALFYFLTQKTGHWGNGENDLPFFEYTKGASMSSSSSDQISLFISVLHKPVPTGIYFGSFLLSPPLHPSHPKSSPVSIISSVRRPGPLSCFFRTTSGKPEKRGFAASSPLTSEHLLCDCFHGFSKPLTPPLAPVLSQDFSFAEPAHYFLGNEGSGMPHCRAPVSLASLG